MHGLYLPAPLAIGMPIAGLVGMFGFIYYCALYAPQEGPPMAVAMAGGFVGIIAYAFLLLIVAVLREQVEKWRAKQKSPG